MAQFSGEMKIVSLRLRDKRGRGCMKAPRAGGWETAFRANALTCPSCGAAAAKRTIWRPGSEEVSAHRMPGHLER